MNYSMFIIRKQCDLSDLGLLQQKILTLTHPLYVFFSISSNSSLGIRDLSGIKEIIQ